MDSRWRWSDEQRVKLRALLDAGLSYAEAGRRFGVTKNAVTRQAINMGVVRGSPIKPRAVQRPDGSPIKPRAVQRPDRRLRVSRSASTLPPLPSLQE